MTELDIDFYQEQMRPIKGAIVFYREGEPSVCWGGGDQNFLGWSKGGGELASGHHKQTAPPSRWKMIAP